MKRLIKIFYLAIYIFFLFLSFEHYHTINVTSYTVFNVKTDENCDSLCDLCLLLHTQFHIETNNFNSFSKILSDLILPTYTKQLSFVFNYYSNRAPPSLS
ncbi:MAG TPA: hypothetical protein PLI27_00075 [Ignavibacteriales bacterium]|nr:hypothetical protein [Ignavibacteriales bacterium]HOL82061.1 hypothetical protein [Ignavibacteriales bacterium]HOM66126.1 hypothetical protein [Ignavibacteriales bacterium]HPD66460.1 hypothetical protein [Ignavibacteriales bacterium]HPP34203.1 hypothetical protein [Ignavibacteriales bacterium]